MMSGEEGVWREAGEGVECWVEVRPRGDSDGNGVCEVECNASAKRNVKHEHC